MNSFPFFLGLFFLTLSSQAQQVISWPLLAGVEYVYSYKKDVNQWANKATFSEELKQLDGQRVQLKGYVLTLDMHGDMLVLSEYPFSGCFFCGGAGQESVVELQMKKKKRFKNDDFRTIEGTFRLNTTEFELSYVLEDAKVVD